MNRSARAAGALLFAALVLLVPALAAADEINVESAAVSFQTVDGERVATFLDFVARSRDFTLSSPRGRYNEATALMTASGRPDARASLAKAGESPFSVSAETEISINFDDETLAAHGEVVFLSDEIDARSDDLVVDRRERLESRIAELKASVAEVETLELIDSFLAKVGPGDRLILLSGNVRIVREDSTLESAWVLVNESDQSEFISIADPSRRMTLTIVTRDEEEGTGSQD